MLFGNKNRFDKQVEFIQNNDPSLGRLPYSPLSQQLAQSQNNQNNYGLMMYIKDKNEKSLVKSYEQLKYKQL